MYQLRWFAFVLCALLACAGCAQKRRPAPVMHRSVKPWIGTQSLCIFPMARTAQHPDPGALAAAMTAGWKSRLDFPEGAEVVHIEPAGRAGAFGTVTIDLSDARIETDRKIVKLKPIGQSQAAMTAQRLELVAHPLLLEKAKLLIGLTADDARLDVRKDKAGRQMLTLTDARDATVTLEVSRKDIDWLILHAARDGAAKMGVSVDRTRLKFDVIDSRVIKVDLKVDTRVALLPAGLRFRARIDIDDDLNGRITRLSCEGDQLLGPIISSFIDPALRKYEGKTRPLVGFEWGKMKLRDVTMSSEDGFRLEAKFGSDTTATQPAPATATARRVGKRT